MAVNADFYRIFSKTQVLGRGLAARSPSESSFSKNSLWVFKTADFRRMPGWLLSCFQKKQENEKLPKTRNTRNHPKIQSPHKSRSLIWMKKIIDVTLASRQNMVFLLLMEKSPRLMQ